MVIDNKLDLIMMSGKLYFDDGAIHYEAVGGWRWGMTVSTRDGNICSESFDEVILWLYKDMHDGLLHRCGLI